MSSAPPVPLSDDGGIVKVVLTPGTGPAPKQKQSVRVNYEGRLLSTGDVFDSSGSYPFQFRLGCQEVIRGWDVAVASMRIGEKARVTIRPEYAYGKEGAGDDIPPDATLEFDIELLAAADVIVPGASGKDADLERLKAMRAERESAAKQRQEATAKQQANKDAKAVAAQAKLAPKTDKGGRKK